MSAEAAWRLPTRPSAWWLAGLVAILHLAFARASVTVPYVFGDEAGYLTKAAALAGLATDAYSSYYPGYALLLTPLYAITPYTLAIYPWVQLLNALLAGAAAWLLLALADGLAPDRPASARWWAAAAAGCYAPGLAYSSFALSENLFIPLMLLLTLWTVREVVHASLCGWMVALVAGVGLMLTHPKGILAVAAVGLGWLVGAWRGGRAGRIRVLGWMGVCLAVFVCVHLLATRFFRHSMGYYSDGVSGHYPGADALLRQLVDLLSVDHASAMAMQLAGQLFYLGVATLGLVLLGLAPSRRGCGGPAAGSVPGACAYAVIARGSLVLTMFMTAFFMKDGTRVDVLFYGRYDEGVVALVLLPVLVRAPPRRAWWLAAAVLAALGLLQVAVRGSELRGDVVQLNIFGAQLWRFLGAVGTDHVNVAILAMAGTASVVLLGWMGRERASSLMVASVFLLAAWQGSTGYLAVESRTNADRHRIADRLHRQFPTESCVDYDIRAGEYWQRYNYQVLLLPMRMHETAVSPLAPGQADDHRTHARCSELVISTSPDVRRHHPDARLLERENGSDERLWWVPHRGNPDEN